MKRILSIVLCLVLVASLCAAASADYKPGQFQIKIATVTSGTHPWVQMGDYIAKELNERSNGAIEVTVAPGGQLGNDEATIDDMQAAYDQFLANYPDPQRVKDLLAEARAQAAAAEEGNAMGYFKTGAKQEL
ncbi:MAG: hypothetical protein IKO13_01890, partial [Oscillospiraceae bacterium]|nr:hypothetical protein [Oscillospiraceae bacterium]